MNSKSYVMYIVGLVEGPVTSQLYMFFEKYTSIYHAKQSKLSELEFIG